MYDCLQLSPNVAKIPSPHRHVHGQIVPQTVNQARMSHIIIPSMLIKPIKSYCSPAKL